MNPSVNSLLSLEYTYLKSGYTCIASVYPLHISSAYVVTISGLLCFITRLIPRVAWTHVYFGRLYLLSMLWGTGSSLLIHNTGLPSGVIVSFVIVLVGLTLGWPIINLHQMFMQTKALNKVQMQLQSAKDHPAIDLRTPGALDAAIAQAKGQIIQERTVMQRVFSLKTLHGALMTTSWLNIAGRTFITNSGESFSCYTQPAYKNLTSRHYVASSNSTFKFIPEVTPEYDKLPWVRFSSK